MNIVSSALSPNTDFHDVRRALHVLVRPWQWKKGSAVQAVEQWFFRKYRPAAAVTFHSGRTALWALLQALGVGAGDEVVIQAFTCVAVSNSVRWAGATPIYADIDTSLNIDPRDIERNIGPRTKAVIVQHTFGIPADLSAIAAITEKHKLLLIEDCAHSIGATYKGKDVGTYGDAAFFSFGRDKAVSSVWGGVAVINRTCKEKNAAKRLARVHDALAQPGFFWIMQQLLHPIAFSLILPTYRSGIGKVMLVVLQRLNLLSMPVDRVELTGKIPKSGMAQYPNALASLVLFQLAKLDDFITIRRNNAAYYKANLPQKFQRVAERSGSSFLRFPILVDQPGTYRTTAKKRGILLGNWYHHVIDPSQVNVASIGYAAGSCPRAEWAAAHIVNLPTQITACEAEKVVAVLRQ